MIYWFMQLSPVVQALLATIFTWAVTALGASAVFFVKRTGRRIMAAMLGFAGGVMLAACCWSLLIPAIERSEDLGIDPVLPAFAGLIAGGVFMLAGDRYTERAKRNTGLDKCSRMLMFSITLHNIPEGMCVGVAFGAAALGIPGAGTAGACMLALGIGLQNFPEGAAVSLPMLRSGISCKRAFFFGQLSGAVEPIAGVTGAILVMQMRSMLPFMLSFAAGAMIYAVAGEIFPEARENKDSARAAFFAILGFAVMMTLDIMLG